MTWAGTAWAGAAWAGSAVEGSDIGGPFDPLELLSDNFGGDVTDVESRGFTWYGESTIATQTVSGGELHIEGVGGGATGAWWYSSGGVTLENGNLLYKSVTGDFDVRARVRVRNAAGSGSPSTAALEWRFAGLQAQDPAGLAGGRFNYVHLGLGADPNGQNRLEWKVTDDDGVTGDSTFDSEAVAAPLDYDLRMVRDGQTFRLYFRASVSTVSLRSAAGFTQIGIGDIEKDANTPARSGVTGPIAFPDTLAVGIMGPYSGPTPTLDLQIWIEEIVYITP
jgi:hypothetical protein